jgi:hypothetical protein
LVQKAGVAGPTDLVTWHAGISECSGRARRPATSKLGRAKHCQVWPIEQDFQAIAGSARGCIDSPSAREGSQLAAGIHMFAIIERDQQFCRAERRGGRKRALPNASPADGGRSTGLSPGGSARRRGWGTKGPKRTISSTFCRCTGSVFIDGVSMHRIYLGWGMRTEYCCGKCRQTVRCVSSLSSVR